jgi:hypothetical protein
LIFLIKISLNFLTIIVIHDSYTFIFLKTYYLHSLCLVFKIRWTCYFKYLFLSIVGITVHLNTLSTNSLLKIYPLFINCSHHQLIIMNKHSLTIKFMDITIFEYLGHPIQTTLCYRTAVFVNQTYLIIFYNLTHRCASIILHLKANKLIISNNYT